MKELSANYNPFIRYGLLIIGLAGIIFAIGDALIPQDGAMFMATEDPQAFAALVTTENFQYWALRGMIGIPMEVIGSIALFFGLISTRHEKWAFWGMLLTVVPDVFMGAMFSMMYYVFPEVGELILSGNEAAASIGSLDAFMPIMGAGFIITALGLLLFALAIWKSTVFPKWSGFLALAGWILILFPGYFIQIFANLVWGAAYFWMAIYSWKKFSN